MKTTPMETLLQLMARLRDPEKGCPWDVQQTFASIAPYTIEEAYEVADAIERGDLDDLKDELGDLLFQVVFHARMAEELGTFNFDQVAQGIVDKMVRRHPHVFANARYANAAEQSEAWEQIKSAERAGGKTSLMDGVTAGLPEWQRALKLQKRAAQVGFDWPDAQGPLEKVHEELQELQQEMNRGSGQENRQRLEEELGDVFFALINLSRHLGVDPGRALRGCNRRFEQRFRTMEQTSDQPLDQCSSEQLESLWAQAKESE